jgi:putative DNA primase/helicase
MITKTLNLKPKPEGGGKPSLNYKKNDAGAAQAFADRYTDHLRFAPGIGWLVWNGHRWERDAIGRVVQYGIELHHTLMAEVSAIRDEAERKASWTWANGLGNRSRIDAMTRLAESNPALVVRAAQLDADPFLVGCQNGTIDLQSGRFFEGDKGDLITRSLGTRWEEGSTCPKWEKFLDGVTMGDAELVAFIQKAMGLTLSGDVSEATFLFLWGTGANGKSVLSDTLASLMGDYCHRASAELFDRRHDRNKGPELAEVHGKRLILASETQEGGRLDERLVKDITGGEEIRGEAKFMPGFKFRPVAKVWISGNHRPRITGTDHGIWRRVRLLPFEAKFEGNADNKSLRKELREELPGIFAWAVEGFRRWKAEGLGLPERVKLAVADYRAAEDDLADFIADRIEEATDAVTCPKGTVFREYESWTEAEGIRHPMMKKQLSRKLRERGWKELHGKFWRGVRIAEEKPEEEERSPSNPF